ncbi:TatD family hydrolase [Lacimicrobium alkaliphilum]|uniref:3'-5' ssDNA/RNA exonuclease TatD n=1 Tax=Lacimicrobium alkaliphilum TaxID=1526571 RepID=A0ABQ1RNV4_9ALTE|nr:TatD family hydrolase [Lacimicrobium alkaliphilum]GGD76442.1 3'-5' ssDNA/RNA exonuclease TatD [Lacimicrobium alkaliphilum]
MNWFDIGVNLTNSRFSKDLGEVLGRAQAGQVTEMLITGTSESQSEAALSLAEQYNQYSTAGVHPHDASSVDKDYLHRLRDLADSPRVRAIGECGLDFNRNFSARDDQLRVFEQQLELAVELQLPVFLHERDAFSEQITLLKKYRPGLVGGVAHCFTGDREKMESYLQLDLYIGITGWLCDKKRGLDLRNAVPHLPLQRLLLETDAPFLTPKTLRPKTSRNEPGFLPHIAEALSGLIQVPVEQLALVSTENAQRLFNIHTGNVNGRS